MELDKNKSLNILVAFRRKYVFMQSLNSLEPPPHPHKCTIRKGSALWDNYTHKGSKKNAKVRRIFQTGCVIKTFYEYLKRWNIIYFFPLKKLFYYHLCKFYWYNCIFIFQKIRIFLEIDFKGKNADINRM